MNADGTPQSYLEWFTVTNAQSVPWLRAGPNGQAEGNYLGTTLDLYRTQLRDGIKLRWPNTASADSLPRIGADRVIVQGPNESQSSYQTRLNAAMDTWPRAGTACGVLEQLAYYTQSNAAVWVQQNGLAYQLSSMPTPGQDPTSLVVATACSQLAVALTSNVTPPTNTSSGRSIPGGNPWWEFDSNTDLTNRFAIYFPQWPFAALTTAYFVSSDNAAVTWPFQMPASYSIQIGTPVVTDGNGGVVLHADGATQTTTGVTIRSSAPFTGYASVVAYAAGVNPLNTFSAANAGQLKSIISAWRPNAVCVGVYAAISGKVFGWPVQAQSANTMGACTISQIIPQFQ